MRLYLLTLVYQNSFDIVSKSGNNLYKNSYNRNRDSEPLMVNSIPLIVYLEPVFRLVPLSRGISLDTSSRFFEYLQ